MQVNTMPSPSGKWEMIWKNPDSCDTVQKMGNKLKNLDRFETVRKMGNDLEHSGQLTVGKNCDFWLLWTSLILQVIS